MYVSENILLWNYKSKWLVSWNTFWLKSDLSLVPLYWYAAAWEIWGYPYYQSHVSERSEDTLITSHMWVTRHERSEDTPITSHMWVTRHERSEDTPLPVTCEWRGMRDLRIPPLPVTCEWHNVMHIQWYDKYLFWSIGLLVECKVV